MAKAARVFCVIALLVSTTAAMAQVCKTESIERSTLPEQFLDNGDGTITDASTGLMWMRCSLGQTYTEGRCSGSARSFSWSGGLTAANSLNSAGGHAGYANWRVPNIKELSSIVEYQCHSPAIDLAIFPDTPAETYWSSTPVDTSTGRQAARSIHFVYGSDLSPTIGSRLVRLVRNTRE